MDVRQLRCLVAIVDEGSFSGAARRLDMTQPAVSLQIRRLEEALGEPVFHRNGRSIALTPLGEAILPHARDAFRALQNAETAAQSVRGVISGTVTIGTIPGCGDVGLPEMIVAFRDSYSLVSTTLIESSADDLIRRVTSGELDLAIVGTAAPSTHGLPSRVLTVSRMVAVVPASHDLAGRIAIPLNELLRHDVMCTPPGSGIRAALDFARKAAGLDIVVRYESGNPDMLVRFAAIGLGIGIVPDDPAIRARQDIAVLDIVQPEVIGNLELIWTARSAASPAVRELIRLAEKL